MRKRFTCLLLSAAMLLTACGKKAEKTFDSLASFEGSTIAVFTGAAFDTLIDPVIPNVTYKSFNLLSDQAAAVLSGKVDAMAVDEPVGRLIAANTPELAMFPETVIADEYGFAISKGSKLTEQANTVLEKLRADGTLDQIAGVWFSADSEQKKLPELTYKPDFDGSAGTLRYGCDTTNEPLSYSGAGGQPIGYDLDVISRIAYELNMTLEPIPMNFEALLAALDAGKVDMVGGGMSMTPERLQQVDFVGPYYKGGVVLLAKKERIAASGGTDTGNPQLDKAKVGAMTGATGAFYIEKNHPQAELREYDDIADAVAALKGNKLDYVITAYTTALNYARNNPELEVLPEPLLDDICAIAVAKENTALYDRLGEAMTALRQDGTLDAIISNWIREDGSAYVIADIPAPQSDAAVLRVGVAANREPMCFVSDGKIVGLDCELIERLAHKMNMRVEYVDMKFSALITALQSGKVDVAISNLSPTEERKEKVNFTEAYFDNPQVLLKRK